MSVNSQVRTGVIALISAALLTSSTASAGIGFGPRAWLGRGHVLKELQLTDNQKAQIKDIFAKGRESLRASYEQLRQRQMALREATRTEPFDEGLVRSHAQELAQAQAEMMVARARLANEALGVLIPEQRAKLDDLRQQRQQHFRGRWQHRSSGAGGQKS